MVRGRKSTVSDKSYVGFEVGSVRYAIEIARVREALRPLAVLAVPDVRDGLLGVADYRGQVLPVVDLRVRFGVEAPVSDRAKRWLIVDTVEGVLALVVDRVTQVIGGSEQRKREVPELARGGRVAPILGAHADRAGLVLLLDVDRLITHDALRRLTMPPFEGTADGT